ncbi:MAG: DUF4827 domain-containing protein [Bacteroidales bacterium]|nr:DUF4827 domain-containing protein [Bacteroidales bacterium]
MFTQLLRGLAIFCASALLFTACSEEDTYADLREKEVEQIKNFLKKGVTIRDLRDNYDLIKVPAGINAISEETFKAQGEVTDTSKNEYVLFASTGVYMQIVRKGTGKKLNEGERATLLCRYTEYNIARGKIISTNLGWNHEHFLDRLSVTNNSGTYTGAFISGMMYNTYQQSFVPSAWLAPLPYLKLGRQSNATEEIAKVRLIVPSTEGQAKAQQAVYPTFYEITYQRSR